MFEGKVGGRFKLLVQCSLSSLITVSSKEWEEFSSEKTGCLLTVRSGTHSRDRSQCGDVRNTETHCPIAPIATRSKSILRPATLFSPQSAAAEPLPFCLAAPVEWRTWVANLRGGSAEIPQGRLLKWQMSDSRLSRSSSQGLAHCGKSGRIVVFGKPYFSSSS
jgi:hypothetical protein